MANSSPILFCVLLCCTIFISCENSEEDINALGKKKVMVNEAVKVESYLSQGGKIKAKLTAPLMLRAMADTTYTEFPKSLHVDFYNAAKVVESRLDAKYGKYFETQNKVYLRDSVKVINQSGDTLLCHDLWWDQDKELFYSHKPVKLKRPYSDWFDGKDGIEATQDLKTITFKESQGRITTAPGQSPMGGTAPVQ